MDWLALLLPTDPVFWARIRFSAATGIEVARIPGYQAYCHSVALRHLGRQR